jgi:hypothetical protein
VFTAWYEITEIVFLTHAVIKRSAQTETSVEAVILDYGTNFLDNTATSGTGCHLNITARAGRNSRL